MIVAETLPPLELLDVAAAPPELLLELLELLLLLLEPQAAMARAAANDSTAPPMRLLCTLFSLVMSQGTSLGARRPFVVTEL